jgi:hypothetical protein
MNETWMLPGTLLAECSKIFPGLDSKHQQNTRKENANAIEERTDAGNEPEARAGRDCKEENDEHFAK